MCGNCSNLTIKAPEGRYQRRSCLFIDNSEQFLNTVPVFPLLTLKVNTGWEVLWVTKNVDHCALKLKYNNFWISCGWQSAQVNKVSMIFCKLYYSSDNQLINWFIFRLDEYSSLVKKRGTLADVSLMWKSSSK